MQTNILFLLSLTALIACSDKGDDTSVIDESDADADTDADTDADADADADTQLRLIHLSPDAPTVDVFANMGDDPAVAGLSFPEGTDYLTLPADTYDFQLSVSGTTAAEYAYQVEGLPLDADTAYTAVAHGYLGDGSLTVTPLVDDTADIADGSFRVQVFHAANASAFAQVDVWNITGGEASPLIVDFDYGVGVVADLPAGAYDICLDVNDDSGCDASFSLPDLPADIFVNLYAVNDMDGNPFLVAHLPDGATARINPN